jgi:hypothetical protein
MGAQTPNFDLVGVCQRIEKYAGELAGPNYAFNLGRQTGAIDFILDPLNGGIKSELSQKGDKAVRGKVFYRQRTKPCEILDGDDAKEAGICDEGESAEFKEVDVELSDAIANKPRRFAAADMAAICQNTQTFVNYTLATDMRAMRERLDEKILSKLAVDIGVKKRHDGTSVAADQYTNVQLLGTSNGQPIPLIGNYQAKLLADYRKMQFTGIPALIGEGNLDTFYNLADMSCCNSSLISFDAAVGKAKAAYFFDQAANSILGDGGNRFIMAAFGASHLLWYNKNHAININTPTNQHRVIQDPVYPRLKWDLDFKWDECDEVWKYHISASFDLFNVFQADSFSSDSGQSSPSCDDELLGVTGLWGYKATEA